MIISLRCLVIGLCFAAGMHFWWAAPWEVLLLAVWVGFVFGLLVWAAGEWWAGRAGGDYDIGEYKNELP